MCVMPVLSPGRWAGPHPLRERSKDEGPGASIQCLLDGLPDAEALPSTWRTDGALLQHEASTALPIRILQPMGPLTLPNSIHLQGHRLPPETRVKRESAVMT
jgi:hypothetical protein